MEEVVGFMPLGKELQVQLARWLGDSHSWSGRCREEKNLALPGRWCTVIIVLSVPDLELHISIIYPYHKGAFFCKISQYKYAVLKLQNTNLVLTWIT
jgi:hypothetical protein